MKKESLSRLSWQLQEVPVSEDFLARRAQELNISATLCRLLYQRGMTTYQDMHFFLSPGLRYLPALETWPRLQEGADVIASSVASGQKIAIWGDYDVDGITSTALLREFFAHRGIEPRCYLPHRVQDGYGLNTAGIETLAREGVQTLITVDCGVSDHCEISRAKELGMRVVLTDHHLPGKDLPDAHVIINPKSSGDQHNELSGVGTVFFLAAALNRTLPGPSMDIRELLDLVALGTLADVVPLDSTNRILVKNGLLLLNQAQRPGIYALKEAAGFGGSDLLGAGEVGFGLAPRINAAGRLDDPSMALELLLCQDLEKARQIAGKLNRLNQQRKKTEDHILEQAREQVTRFTEDSGLVLFDPDWHPGVLGIVASRLAEEFYRPCFVLTQEDGLIKGSGRSISGFNLYQGLCSLQSELSGFGGHKLAAGLSMSPEKLENFREEFKRVTREWLGPVPLKKELTLDGLLDFKTLTPEFLQELELLQPFGPENPRPVFLSPPLKVLDQSLFGNDKHVRFLLQDTESGTNLRGQFWREGARWGQKSLRGKHIVLAYTPAINNYQGLISIRLNIKEILDIME